MLKWVTSFSAALLLMVPSVQTRSATFDLKPGSVTLEPDHPIAQVAFSSLNARAVVFDATVSRWTQTQGRDVFSPAGGLIVLPPVFLIQPYGTTLLRVARRQREGPPDIEQSYKILVTEALAGASIGLKSPRIFSFPVFVRPRSITGTASFALKLKPGGQAELIVANATNAHVYIGKLSIESGGQTVYEGNPGVYELAGQTGVVQLRLSAAVSSSDADLVFEDDQGKSISARASVSK